MLVCFSQSTAHGLMHIGIEGGLPGKIVWLALTVATCAIFIGHTYSLYTQMIHEQVFISTIPDSVDFIQPDIVFCSERIFARDYINHPPADEYEFMLNVSRSIKKFDQLYANFSPKSSKIIWDSLDYFQLYKAFYHRKAELFLSVTCNLDKIDLKNLEVEMNVAHFACFRLSSKHCQMDSPFNSLIVKFYIHIYGQNISYTTLDVGINNRTLDSYLFKPREVMDEVGDGVHVYFVQPNEAVNDRTMKVVAGANTQTDIRIKSTRHERQSTKRSKCQQNVRFEQFYNLLEEDFTRNPINVTEHSFCAYKQFQYMLFRSYKCVSKLFPIPVSLGPKLRFCGDLHRGKHNVSAIFSKMSYQKVYETENIMKKCECTRPCTSITHKVSVNYNRWPWGDTLRKMFSEDIPRKLDTEMKQCPGPGLLESVQDFKKNPNNIFKWEKNFLKITISSDEFKSTEVVESPSYSLKNFFSDVGGIMGFYMGASLLTVCELFRVIYVTLYALIVKRYQKRYGKKEEKEDQKEDQKEGEHVPLNETKE